MINIKYKELIIDTLIHTKRTGIDKLISWLENKSDYFTAPASTNHHNNFEGGLMQHSWNVYELFQQKNQQYNLNLSDDVVSITALMHDLCKVNFYTKEKKNILKGKKTIKKNKKVNGVWKEVEENVNDWQEEEVFIIDDSFPVGHGEKSVIILQNFITLKQEETLLIRWHMGLPEDYISRKIYVSAVEKCPGIIALHSSDLESSHLLESNKIKI